MRTRFLYRRLTASMMLSFFVFLHQPVSALENINLVFFVDNKDNIELKAPAYNGVGRLVWEWKPHSRKEIQKLWTFHWIKRYGRWRKERNYWENQALYQNIINNRGTFNLKVIKPAFKFAGLFTLTQTEPKNQILKQYELFGIRVEASSKRPMAGTDIILSCSISRLPDTVSLHWKQKGSSQLNRRNVEQICLNNTAYLMVRHVAEEDKNLFECEVQENGSRLYTEGVNLLLDNDAYWKKWTLFRSSTDYDELHLNLKYASCIYFFHLLKGAASATINNPIIVNSANFGNRMVTSVKYFRLNIVPVLFEDAGDYTCYCNQVPYTSIHLITVKVTAEPPDPLTEEDTVTLTCSVSELAESMRLVWINSIAKTAREMRATAKEKSVRLTIHKFERGRGDWRCGLFTKNVPQLLVPYYLKPSGSENSIYFFHQEGYFVLNGPVNPGIGSIVWEWRPHSAQQTTRRLATFHRNSQWWTVQWNDEYQKTQGISQRIRVDWGTLNMRIRKPTFELAGLFTWNQIHAGGKILREWEVFGIKVEADSHRPVMGSDITLCCTISRLPDTVSLHWKPRGSSQQNKMNNTDQIHLNNTIYLIVQHVGVGSPQLYTWEMRENGSTVLTGNPDIEVDWDLSNKKFTVYRSDKDDSELDLICGASAEFTDTKWTWRSQRFQNQVKDIASTRRSQPINIDRSYFGNRLGARVGNLSGMNFSLRIVPVRFEDAGVYTCSIGTYKHVTIELITVKVTPDSSEAETEGNKVTLTCTVSEVSESMKLVWINDEGKVVEEKYVMEQQQKHNSLQLVIQKAEEAQRKWTCGLFHQHTPKVFIPFHLQAKSYYLNTHHIVLITGGLALLIIILLILLLRRKCKLTGINETPVPESRGISEYASVSHKAKQQDIEEDIHYGSISFLKEAPTGHRHDTPSSNQASDANLSSREDDSSVIYAQIVYTRT